MKSSIYIYINISAGLFVFISNSNKQISRIDFFDFQILKHFKSTNIKYKNVRKQK